MAQFSSSIIVHTVRKLTSDIQNKSFPKIELSCYCPIKHNLFAAFYFVKAMCHYNFILEVSPSSLRTIFLDHAVPNFQLWVNGRTIAATGNTFSGPCCMFNLDKLRQFIGFQIHYFKTIFID